MLHVVMKAVVAVKCGGGHGTHELTSAVPAATSCFFFWVVKCGVAVQALYIIFIGGDMPVWRLGTHTARVFHIRGATSRVDVDLALRFEHRGVR